MEANKRERISEIGEETEVIEDMGTVDKETAAKQRQKGNNWKKRSNTAIEDLRRSRAPEGASHLDVRPPLASSML